MKHVWKYSGDDIDFPGCVYRHAKLIHSERNEQSTISGSVHNGTCALSILLKGLYYDHDAHLHFVPLSMNR